MNKAQEKGIRAVLLWILRPFGLREQKIPKPDVFDRTVIYGKHKKQK